MRKWCVQYMESCLLFLPREFNWSVGSKYCLICVIHFRKFEMIFSILGIYPDCECMNEGHIFSAYINQCYIPCPGDSTGKHPYCRCDKSDFYYDENEGVCKSNVGRKCPKFSIGTGPNCLCTKTASIFNIYFWECQHPRPTIKSSIESTNCPDSSQKWPQCDVSIHRNALFSLVG